MTKTFHYLTAVTCGFDHQAPFKGFSGDGAGNLSATTLQALHQTASFEAQLGLSLFFSDFLKTLGYKLGLCLHVPREGVVFPVVLNGRCGGNKRVVITANGTVMLTGQRLIQIRTEHYLRQMQPCIDQISDSSEYVSM